MSALTSFSTDEVIERGSIKDADISKLRTAYYEDGLVSTKEAEILFALHNNCQIKDTAWATFFTEAVVDYVVRQAEPEGYVTVENATWLIERLTENGKVRSRADLELLVTILELARWSPPSFVKFCIEQVRYAILDDDSPLRGGANQHIGKILESEVELLRRMVYAFGGDANIAVTRAEAEVLFEINDTVSAVDGNPAWTEFFVKAVANAVMASSGYAVPSREQAMSAEAWLENRGDLSLTNMDKGFDENASQIISNTVDDIKAGLFQILNGYKVQSREELALARLELQRLEIVTNEVVPEDNAQWLGDRLGRDGHLSPAEHALVEYLHENAVSVHPSLENVIARLSRSNDSGAGQRNNPA